MQAMPEGMVAGVTQINFRLPAQVESVGNLAFALQIGEAFSNGFAIYIKPQSVTVWHAESNKAKKANPSVVSSGVSPWLPD